MTELRVEKLKVPSVEFNGESTLPSISENLRLTFMQDEFELSEDGSYYIVAGIGECTDTELVIPAEYKNKPVKEIKAEAFKECADLTSVVIPDSVIEIGYSAFKGCYGLTTITIPFVGNTKDGTEKTYFGYIFGAGHMSISVLMFP